MDDSQYEYLRYNKYLLRIIGQWPHHHFIERFLVTIIMGPLISAQAVIQCGGVITALYSSDLDAAVEGLSPFIISFMCVCKYVNAILTHGQIKDLLITIQDDWKTYSQSEDEYYLLRRNYEIARKYTIGYAACLYGSMIPFMAVPTILTAADALGFYNISGERPAVFRVEYFLDVEKYYYLLLVHSYIGTLGFVTFVVAIDSMTVAFVQHECGLCEILGYRMERLLEGNNMTVTYEPKRSDDKGYETARQGVILHNHIIEIANKIENSNTVCRVLEMGLNMIGISFTVFQAVAKSEMPNDALRYILFTLCLLNVMFFLSWPGQQLLDHSGRIFNYITDGHWYESSLRTRKIIGMMHTGSYKPLKLTAGKLYTLNLQNYSAVVRTSFSYFTVLCSFQ